MARSSQSTSKPGRGGKRAAGRRDFDALRQRRMRAAEMFRRGKRQVEVAAELGVSAQTASR
ncbi:helix-turn-helix domain-containing protein [Saccharopolyspora sp. NPDC000995]